MESTSSQEASTSLQIQKIIRGTSSVISQKDLEDKLKKKPELKVKAGFDPTAPDMHLGHMVLLRKLRHFQDLGHRVSFLLGDFTGMIGDPTGKSETRKQLTKEEVKENAKTYQDQVFKILIPGKTDVVYNSSWCSSLKLEEVLQLTAKYTVSQLLERDDFRKRYQGGSPISLIEFLYPLIQGYDSVVLESDIEIGGTDQTFNLLVGRELQRSYGKESQVVITMPLLVGLDGIKKMSKSLGNYVGILEKPIDMFGKILSISDELMWNYWELLTDKPLEAIQATKDSMAKGDLHPKEIKSELALAIMNQLHPEDSNRQAKEEWEKIHRPGERAIPQDVREEILGKNWLLENDPTLLPVLVKLNFLPSTSEGRRIIASGGLYLDEQKIKDPYLKLEEGKTYLIRQGKKGKYLRILT